MHRMNVPPSQRQIPNPVETLSPSNCKLGGNARRPLHGVAIDADEPSASNACFIKETRYGREQAAKMRKFGHPILSERRESQLFGLDEAESPSTGIMDHPSMEQIIHSLEACKRKKELEHAKHLHFQMCYHGVEWQPDVGNLLVQVFIECGCILNAHKAFNKLVYRNEYSWTSLILGNAEYGNSTFSFELYQRMKEDCVAASKFTFMALLKACMKMKCVVKGKEIQVEISEKGFENDIIIQNCLVDMFVKCGSLIEARDAVEQMPVRDVITWNTIIAGYVDHDLNEEALICRHRMETEGLQLNDLSYVSLLKACKNLKDLERGRELHYAVAIEGFERDLFVTSSLLDMYSKCGSLLEAKDVFDELPVRDVVVWTTLLTGYIDHGLNEEALTCIKAMQSNDVSPNMFTYLCALKACCGLKDINKGQNLYSEVIKRGFEGETIIGNILVDMYSKCGLLEDAKEVFNLLHVQDAVSWNALLVGYAERGLGMEVLNGFQKMQQDGTLFTSATLVSSLKACTILEALDKGRSIHLQIAQEGYEKDPFVCSALIDMYSKCGSLEEAQDAFDTLKVHDLVTWTTLIAGYNEHGYGEEAMNLLEKMQQEGFSLDAITVVCGLKACISIGNIKKGQDLHAYAVKLGLERNVFITNCLVEMYANCSPCNEAKEVFNKLQVRDVVSWNSLISGFAEQGFYQEVLDCFQQMKSEGVPSNVGTFIYFLKSCGSTGALEHAQKIHAELVENEFEEDLFIGNNLVDMYGKCRLLSEALDVFEDLPVRDVFSWNALIGGYVDNGYLEESLVFYAQMQLEGVHASDITLYFVLKACGIQGSIAKGHELHDEIIRKGLETDTFIGNSLIDMYAKCEFLSEAECILEKLPVPDPASWTFLVAKYAEHGFDQTALELLENMEMQGILPDTISYLSNLKSCMNMDDAGKIQEIYSMIVKRGLDLNLVIGNALLDFYAKCGLLSDAVVVFKILPYQDVISWTALISGYAEHSHDEEALHCFDQMQQEEIFPDAVTYMYALKACGSMGLHQKGRCFHNDIVKKGFDVNSFVGNNLVDMYAKCRSLDEAQVVFDGLPTRDSFSWNALCVGYAELGLADEALSCFQRMQWEGVVSDVVSWNTIILLYLEHGENDKAFHSYLELQEQGLLPDSMAYVNVLKTCGNAAALEVGKMLHAQLHRQLEEKTDIVLSTSLVDMYSKCGSMYDAWEMFEAMPMKDVVAWNALLTGYARHGGTDSVLFLFERMIEDGIQPDIVAFLNVLTVCCHAGLVGAAQKYFELMIAEYRITPSVEHINCLVDLLGRAGQLNAAVRILENIPFQPDSVLWSTMLAACQKWGDKELGKQAFDSALSLDEEHSAAFVLMSNISADPCTVQNVGMEAMD